MPGTRSTLIRMASYLMTVGVDGQRGHVDEQARRFLGKFQMISKAIRM